MIEIKLSIFVGTLSAIMYINSHGSKSIIKSRSLPAFIPETFLNVKRNSIKIEQSMFLIPSF